MNTPNSSFSVNVDPTNPGQFFACCGLLELADRLWPNAEGWFAEDGRRFYVACGEHDLAELLAMLAQTTIQSSLGDDGLKRLGTLLSAAKDSLTAQDRADKERLRQQWRVERVTLTAPFNITIDWWWDVSSGVTLLKTWAAKQFVLSIARPLLSAIRTTAWTERGLDNCLTTTAKISGLPFYFDAANNTQNTPRDFGVSTADVKMAPSDRPLVELLTFIALQRYRPSRQSQSDLIQYAIWKSPHVPSTAAAIASGCVELPDVRKFGFRMLYRTEYMKAFLPSAPVLSIGDQ